MIIRRLVVAIVAGLIISGCSGAPIPTGDELPAVEPVPLPLGAPLGEHARKTTPVHVNIHGLYMTGWIAGSDHFYELVDYMLQSGLNAVVIDAQDDDGHISWETDIPLANELGAHIQKVQNIEERLQYLRERQIYAIARVVVYADPLLGEARPELSIMGGRFVDSRGIRWPDPYNQTVWEYKVEIAKDAARRGFDEIQFDYIRFPEHRIEGYNWHVPVEQRTQAIVDFLRYAMDELKPRGVFVSADVFGLTTSVAEGDDMEIGQDYAQIARAVDYVLPMVYPSHYSPGTYGVSDPNAEPGRIVYESLVAAQKRTWELDTNKHRAWIQDFDYGKHYTAADIEAQIRGLAEAGIYQWVLWDPHNRYTRSVDYSVGGGKHGPPGTWRQDWQPPRSQRWTTEMEHQVQP